jgi:hypothetical protein
MASKTLGGLIITGALLVGAPAAWALGATAPHASVNGSGEAHADVQSPQMPQPKPHVTVARPEIKRPTAPTAPTAPSAPDSTSVSAHAQATAQRSGAKVRKQTDPCTCSPVTTIAPKPADPKPTDAEPAVPSDGRNNSAGSNGSVGVSISGELHAGGAR